MSESNRVSTLTLLVDAGQDTSPDDLDALTRQLRSELQDLDVESVSVQRSGAGPAGTKAGEASSIGMLIVQLFPSVVPALIGFLQAWSMRGRDRTVTVKLTADSRSMELQIPAGTNPDDVEQLVQTIAAALR